MYVRESVVYIREWTMFARKYVSASVSWQFTEQTQQLTHILIIFNAESFKTIKEMPLEKAARIKCCQCLLREKFDATCSTHIQFLHTPSRHAILVRLHRRNPCPPHVCGWWGRGGRGGMLTQRAPHPGHCDKVIDIAKS